MKKLVKQYGQPRGMITDKLRNYSTSEKEVTPSIFGTISPRNSVWRSPSKAFILMGSSQQLDDPAIGIKVPNRMTRAAKPTSVRA